jgi:toxin ParE1/3/4
MTRYRVSRDAEKELDEIFVYWAKRVTVDIADRLIDAITGRFWVLGEHPDAGRSCEDLAPGVRCFPAGKYLIYYRKGRSAVEIPHVFHGARDQARALKRARKE